MLYRKSCPKCKTGDCYPETDSGTPAIEELVCIQCGFRQVRQIAVDHPPIQPPEPSQQTVLAVAQSESIGYLYVGLRMQVDTVMQELRVSRSTVFRGVRRFRGRERRRMEA